MGAVIDQQDDALVVTSEFNAPPVIQQFLEDPTELLGLFGPFGSAKTTSGCLKTWIYGANNPGAKVAVIRDTWPNLRDTTMKTFFEWFPNGTMGRYEPQLKTFWLNPLVEGDPPTEVVFRAMYDQADMENVLSLDLAAAHFDEPQGGISYRGEQGIAHEPGMNKTLFEGILARLGRQKGYPPMGWLTGNPPSPTHWIAKFFGYFPGTSGKDPPTNLLEGIRLYLADQDTNRANLPQGYYERLTRLFGVGTPMARRFIEGLWIDFAQTKPFHREWIQHAGIGGAPDIPTEGLRVEIGYDPAFSKKDAASKTAIVVAGQHLTHGETFGRIFVLHAEAGHWSTGEAVDRLMRLCRAYGVRTVRVEKVAAQVLMKDVIDPAAKTAGLNLTVEMIPPSTQGVAGDKLSRANAWSPQVQDGRVIFGPGTAELVDAMCEVPDNAQAWDLVDAAGYCIRHFRKLPDEQTKIVTPLQHSHAYTYATQPTVERGGFVNPPPGQPLRARQRGPINGSRAGGYAVKRGGYSPHRPR